MGIIAEWLLAGLILAIVALSALWTAGAIYYDACGGARWGRFVVAAWVVGIVTLFAVWQPLWQPFLGYVAVLVLIVVWWLSQKPSHHRDWDASVSLLPRAVLDGDVVTIENVRNFDYPAPDVFTPRYESRKLHLSNLKNADLLMFNWGVRLMSHPVLVFDFGPDGRVGISIEVRYRKGQQYSVVRSFYRQQELIFLVADERDIILRRTRYSRNQTAHLYHMNVSPEALKTAFLDYLGAINDLYEKPRWYHGLCANCTTSFYRLPHSRSRRDWRVIANGRLDQALYEDGRLDRTLPFEELQRLALINEIANGAPEAGFGDFVRRELEKRRHER